MCLQPLVDIAVSCGVGACFESQVEQPNERSKGATFCLGVATVIRIALAVAGVFTLMNSAPVFALVVGALVSLPATMIAVGSLGMYYGSAAVIASLATGSFATLGYGLLSIGLGYGAIQYYRTIPIGIIECCFDY